jgi:endoglucanase
MGIFSCSSGQFVELRTSEHGHFSFTPGNVVPGILFRKRDRFENYDDWLFLWGENEGTIGGNTDYLIFGSAFLGVW